MGRRMKGIKKGRKIKGKGEGGGSGDNRGESWWMGRKESGWEWE